MFIKSTIYSKTVLETYMQTYTERTTKDIFVIH